MDELVNLLKASKEIQIKAGEELARYLPSYEFRRLCERSSEVIDMIDELLASPN